MQQRSRALVEAVVEAGCRILANHGWDGFKMCAVAELAGVSSGSLYQYFPNKAALITEIIERESRLESAYYVVQFSAIPADADMAEVMDNVVRTVLAYQRSRGSVMRQALAAISHTGRYSALVERASHVVSIVRNQLEVHSEAFPDTDPVLAAHVLANAIYSLTHDGVLPRFDGLDDQTLAAEISRLVRGYLFLGGSDRRHR